MHTLTAATACEVLLVGRDVLRKVRDSSVVCRKAFEDAFLERVLPTLLMGGNGVILCFFFTEQLRNFSFIGCS